MNTASAQLPSMAHEPNTLPYWLIVFSSPDIMTVQLILRPKAQLSSVQMATLWKVSAASLFLPLVMIKRLSFLSKPSGKPQVMLHFIMAWEMFYALWAALKKLGRCLIQQSSVSLITLNSTGLSLTWRDKVNTIIISLSSNRS